MMITRAQMQLLDAIAVNPWASVVELDGGQPIDDVRASLYVRRLVETPNDGNTWWLTPYGEAIRKLYSAETGHAA